MKLNISKSSIFTSYVYDAQVVLTEGFFKTRLILFPENLYSFNTNKMNVFVIDLFYC